MGKTIDLTAASGEALAGVPAEAAAKKKWRGLRLFLIGAGGILAALTFITQGQRMTELHQEEERLQAQILELENKTQRLERMIQYSQTDDYIERMAFKQFGWVKPGDVVFYADPEPEAPQAAQTEAPANEPGADEPGINEPDANEPDINAPTSPEASSPGGE